MAKKTEKAPEMNESMAAPEPEEVEESAADGGTPFATDFNVENEYKPTPLVPNGRYNGFVTNVHFEPADSTLVWDITLTADSDVLMSDNDSPVNGVVMQYKNWFPKAGDEVTRTKTGKMTKRQAKINMISDFQKKMGINMNTPEAIMAGVNNAEWVGIEVIAVIEIREYEGRLSNQIKEMFAA